MGIKIGIINPSGLAIGTQQALDALVNAFAKQNIKVHLCLYTDQLPKADIIIGTYEKSQFLRELVTTGQIPLAETPEAIIIKELTIEEHTALWACAYDTRGLLYVLYELAARINAQSIPALYKPVAEKAFLKLRGVLHFLELPNLKKGWTFNRKYWQSYFTMLIENRFNCFTLVLTSPSGAPVLPYLCSVPEHPEVNLFHLPETVRTANLEALRDFAALAQECGLDFQLGFWNSYPPGANNVSKLSGLTRENITSYLYLALKQLLFTCPGISGLEFKFQRGPVERDFCLYTIFQAVLETGNQTSLKFYAAEITPEIRDLLQVSGVTAYVTTECWEGKLGLPYLKETEKSDEFLPTVEDKMIAGYQLTACSPFPWGDPDYLYQLIPALKAKGFDCFQLIPPEKADHEEYARHWYLYHLCGRLAFHPGTTGDVVIRDFHRRFGEKGNELADLYRLAGKILPLYNAVHDLHTTRPELSTGGLLAFYLRTPVGDPALFADVQEYVRAYLNQTELTKIAPLQVAAYLHRLAYEILEKVQSLETVALRPGDLFQTEWQETLVEAKSLAHFALYHSVKLQAAIELAFFSETKDLNCLEEALTFLKKARLDWEKLPASTRQPVTRLLILEDERRLQTLLEEYRLRGTSLIGFDFGGLPATALASKNNSIIYPEYYIEEGFTFINQYAVYKPEVGYGWLETGELNATPAPEVRLSEEDFLSTKVSCFSQGIPFENQLLNKLVWSRQPATFQVDLAPDLYQVHLTFCDRSLTARHHGPMRITLNDEVITEDLMVPRNKRVDLRKVVEVTDGKLTVTFNCPPTQDWFISAISIHPVAPLITHTPVTTWVREKPLLIRATVTGASLIRQVILNYQSENERGYHMVMMTPIAANLYTATIPAVYLEQGDFINYYITALDNQGKEFSLASFENPYTVAVLKKTEAYTPAFFHFPPAPGAEGEEITLKCTVRPGVEVENVTLYYKNEEKLKNQVTMERENAEGEYRAILSGSQLLPDSWLQYRFVVKFKNGDLELFPNPLTSTPYFILRVGLSQC